MLPPLSPPDTPATAAPVPPAMAPAAAEPLLVVAPSHGFGRALWLALVALLVLVLVALALAWKAEQRGVSLGQELVRRQQESSGQASEARLLAKQADEGTREAAAKLALLEARLAEVAIQRSQLEDLIQSLSRSRDENLVVDIEAAIRVALQQAALTGSAEPLVATLKQSDERLARYNQPRLEGVRRAIARDLDRVKSISVTDIATLTIKLDEAVRMVDELPLLAVAETRKDVARPAAAVVAASTASAPTLAQATRSAAAAGARASVAPVASTTGSTVWPQAWVDAWDGATQRIGNEARSLVRVTRIDHPDAMLLAPEQSFFLKENLKLRLLNARLALLSRQFETAQADLLGTQAALERYFDRSARRTQLAAELVKQVATQSRQVILPRPDDTLAALAAAAAGR
jgi:uroporphyrin-III C-methyltransferase